MIKKDFYKLSEIAKEINNIRVRNNLAEIQLILNKDSITIVKEKILFNLVTRGERLQSSNIQVILEE